MGRILAVFVAVAIFYSTVHAEEYLVKYRNESKLQNLYSNFRIKGIHRPGKLLKVDLSADLKVQASLDPNIEYIVPNSQLSIVNTITQKFSLKKQYALKKINAEAAWALTGSKGSRTILVAVIDTGVDYNHKNLSNNVISGGYDFFSNDTNPMDETALNQNRGHGTHCSGIIGANGLVDKGILGISPEVSILPIRVFGAKGTGSVDKAIQAIDYAISKKVQIISASWSAKMSENDARPLIEALERAERAGVIFVAAASNDSSNNDKSDVYPANAKLSNVISVAASTSSDGRAYYSNYGKANVSLAAPGDQIISTLPGNNYDNLSGTSMATPLVAGLIAFLKTQDPTLTGAEVKALLQSSGAKVKIETACNCRIDALAATDMLINKKSWLVPAAGTLKIGATQKFSMKNNNGFVSYTSSNPQFASIDEKTGVLTAKAKGTVTVIATDATGHVAKSVNIYIIK